MNFEIYKPYYRRNLQLAIPVMITQAGQVIVQMADNIMVGHLGTAEFAGVSFTNVIFTIGIVFTICFTQGLTPLAGENYGKGNHLEVTKYLQNSFVLNFLIGIAITIIMVLIVPLMDYMGQDKEILVYGKKYYWITLISILPTAIFFTIRNFSESIGITKYAMYITVAANLLNVLLNWLLIYGKFGFPMLGVSGAAIATLISRVIMLVSFLILIFKLDIYKRFTKLISKPYIDKSKLYSLLTTSMPIALQGLVEVTAFGLTGIIVGWFGKETLAANQIAVTMGTFSFMIAQGIGVAGTIIVSHQFGQQNYKAMRDAGFASCHMSVVLMGFAGLLYVIFRKYIPYIFSTDPIVVEIASQLLIVSAAFQIFDASQLSGLAILRGLKDVKKPLYYSIIAYYLICLPLGYFLSFTLGIGAIGIWIGLLIGLAIAALLYLLRFNILTKRLIGNA